MPAVGFDAHSTSALLAASLAPVFLSSRFIRANFRRDYYQL
jgi:hypothetical protein